MTESLLLAATRMAIGLCTSVADLEEWGIENRAALHKLRAEQQAAIRDQYRARKAAIQDSAR